MKIKHKLLSDYQYITPDKKIFLIKSGTIIEEYQYKLKGENIPIDRDIVEANPQLFDNIDWKAEMLSYMKTQKFPTPSQFHKKLVPFIEDMVLSSIQQNNTPVSTFDESKIREIEWKEKDLNNRDRRIKDKEDEIDIRLKRVEKREGDYKNELQGLDKKEDDLRTRSRELTERQIDLEDKIQSLNEKERNLDRGLLESSKDLDIKYSELQLKIDRDIRFLSEKERDIESKSGEIKRREERLLQLESDIEEVKKYLLMKIEEVNLEESSLMKLDQEIKNWEGLHWKLKRESIPPSAIPETISEELKKEFGL